MQEPKTNPSNQWRNKMRNANPEIVPMIKEKTLGLLMDKNPDEIGMREIAKECGVTATLIYHYYKDKTELFQSIGLDCILKLNEIITEAAEKKRKPKERAIAAAKAFRDWCFENPRKAVLVMQGIESAEEGDPEHLEKYYSCLRTGEKLLKDAVDAGAAKSKNIALDIGVLVSGLWGCCEAVILKKSDAQYWKNGTVFTDRLIEMWSSQIFTK